MEIINLKEATSVSGGKASGLSLLNKLNVPVPNGFVINDTLDLEFNENYKNILEEYLSNLDKNKKLAVRSSAAAEDGENKSFAGVFETELNIDNNINSVLEAIKKVNKSASTDAVKEYTNNEKQKMNIIIQEMVDPKIAGVLFSKAIDINGDDVVLFECVEGLADKLVRGSATPARVIIKLKDNKLDTSNIKIEGELLDLSYLKNIFPYIDQIKELNDKDLDIEWAIDKEGNPYFVQARPITSEVFISKNTQNSATVVSRGYTEAETYVIEDEMEYEEIFKELDKFPEGAILVIGVTETPYMKAIKKASGIITEEGSVLSHAAIVSRELGIPCISGYKDAKKLFPTGTKLTLDAYNSKIIADGVENNLTEKKSFDFGELGCFDNVCKVTIDGVQVFFESTFDGLMLHMSSDDATPENMNKIELYARKVFKTSPEQYFDDKNLWYLEIERFKKLPYYNELTTEMMEIVKTKDSERLNNFYDKYLIMLKDLVYYKEKNANNKEKLIIEEIGAAANFILIYMLPMGYALRECYLESMDKLNQHNITLNDLIVDNTLQIKDSELIKVKEFLSNVAIRRNETYEKITGMGATYLDYFEERDDKVIKTLNDKNATIDSFYNGLKDNDFNMIKNIMNSHMNIMLNNKF